MKLTEQLKDKFQRLKHHASNMTASEEEETQPDEEKDMQENGAAQESEENEYDAKDSSIDETDDISEADRATMLRKKHILTGIGCAGLFVVAMIGSNFLLKSEPAKQRKDPPLSSPAVAEKAQTPANGMPVKYSDITKYADKNQPKGKTGSTAANTKSNAIQPKKQDNVTVASRQEERSTSGSNSNSRNRQTAERSSVRPAGNSGSSTGASLREREAERAAKEAQKVEQDAIASAIAFTQVATGSRTSGTQTGSQANGTQAVAVQTTAAPRQANTSYFEESDSGENGQYALQAGSVIQATLITGITSDMPSGDVVAQVRQNIYDSLTGEHLLIPQGSKLIGKSGSAGGRGNPRIGVTFDRIILPTGESITLPSQKAIDGVGYLGMKDQYTQHTGKLYSTGIMTALIAAAAQSATGNSSGSDDRSPGQEAVAGAVSEILDTMKTVIDREGNVSPTITIRPGFEFSVFINQDLMIPEYQSDL